MNKMILIAIVIGVSIAALVIYQISGAENIVPSEASIEVDLHAEKVMPKGEDNFILGNSREGGLRELDE